MPGSNSSPPAEKHGLLDEPLGLTVHSLPRPGDPATADPQRTRSGRWKMLLVLAICAAPVVASYFTYYVVRPQTRHSYGELVEPQRTMPVMELTALDGRKLSLQSLKGQWLLASVASGACPADCQAHLYLQRQLRESLGKERDRVDWVWIVDDQVPLPAAIQPALAQATVVRADSAALRAWLEPAPGRDLHDHLYLIDPMGNWMMRFPATLNLADAAKAKRDLDRLLRAAASWDLPGRQNP